MNDYSDFSVMVVDDTEANIDILVETIGEEFDLKVAMDGETALEDIAEEPPDLILLDIMMPGMDGYQVCEKLKSSAATKNIPIIFLTAMTEEQNEAKGLSLGAVDYITKPFSPDLVKARVQNQLELKKHRDHLEELVLARTEELALTQEVTVYSLSSLAETRDPETGGHILRTQRYVEALARAIENQTKFKKYLTDEKIKLMFTSAPLHDIGKVGIPDNILLKPGKLTAEEFEEMKTHTTLGFNTLREAEQRLGENSFMSFARAIAYTHHERWDGKGYPRGIKGDSIPLSGRLMAIADVYDALISKRVYKPPFPHKKAVSIIEEGKGTQFDPELVDNFLLIKDKFLEIALKFADFEEERKTLME